MRWFHTTVAASSMAALLALASAPEAQAGQVFTLQNVDITAYSGSDGLTVSTAVDPNAIGHTFELANVGDSYTFSLFNIWTDERSINWDDLNSQPIEVQLAFDPPTGGDPTAGGNTSGEGDFVFFGFVNEYGQVQWNDPPLVTASNGAQYTIDLSDETFNYGLFDLNPGKEYGATVDLTVTLVANPVPEPSTMAMGGIALAIGGLGLWRQQRRRVAA